MNAPTPTSFMVPGAGGGQHVGPMWQSNSMRRALHAARHYVADGRSGSDALEVLRPCLGLHPNATLQLREWIDFDEAVTAAYLEDLVGVADLLGAGLRRNLGNPFGMTVSEWQDVSEMTAAQVSMRAGTPPEQDRVDYATRGVPVPIVSKGFQLDERELEASRTRGEGLDVTQADAATRVVSEGLEDLLFNGSFAYGGYTLQGYTESTSRNTGSLTGAWNTYPTVTAANIVEDVIDMITALHNDNVMGPYRLYIPFGWDPVLNHDYVVGTPSAGLASGTRTIRQRILEAGIQAVMPTRSLTNECVLVAMRRQIVDALVGFEPRLVQWEEQGGMVNYFRVMSIMSFRVKRDFSGRSGIAHFSV